MFARTSSKIEFALGIIRVLSMVTTGGLMRLGPNTIDKLDIYRSHRSSTEKKAWIQSSCFVPRALLYISKIHK